jgi:hypothetical protein
VFPEACDAIVLVHRSHEWRALASIRPLLVCGEMFLGLRDLEPRRLRLWRLREEVRGAMLPVAILADFLLGEDIEWLESTAARIAHGWYLDGDRDRTEYRGVSLGRCCEYDLKAQSIRILKFACSCRRLMARYPGVPIYSDYPRDSREGRLLTDLGVAVLPFDVCADDDLSVLRANPSLRNRLVTRGRLWGVRALEVARGLRRRSPSSDRPVVVVRPSFQSVKMLEAWLEQPRRVEVVVWMDRLTRPRTMWSLVRAGASIVGRASETAPVAEADRARIASDWLARDVCLDIALVTGMPLREAFVVLCRETVERELPEYAKMVDQAYVALDTARAAVLVLPNDCQGPLRAWALVAKRTGTTSLIVQHGHLDYTEDEDHLLGDMSAFWSEAVREQFRTFGLDSRQMVVTGSPNVDEFALDNRHSRVRPHVGPMRVLVITTGNPGVQAYTGETWVMDYITRVLADLCDGPRHFEVAVKLHPGESVTLYTEHTQPWRNQIAALREGGTLASWLAWSDVVVSPPSTVVLEARAKGIPVILLPIPSVEGRPTSLRHLEGVVTLTETDSISSAISQLERDGVAAPGQSEAALPLSWFTGPLDGEASLRLLRAIEAIALESRKIHDWSCGTSEARHA